VIGVAIAAAAVAAADDDDDDAPVTPTRGRR
jgi:hypothetical protein